MLITVTPEDVDNAHAQECPIEVAFHRVGLGKARVGLEIDPERYVAFSNGLMHELPPPAADIARAWDSGVDGTKVGPTEASSRQAAKALTPVTFELPL